MSSSNYVPYAANQSPYPRAVSWAESPNDTVGLSAGTTITQLVSVPAQAPPGRRQPGIIDLRDGRKWRMPDLYAVARLLEMDPVVSELVFTESGAELMATSWGPAFPTSSGARSSKRCRTTLPWRLLSASRTRWISPMRRRPRNSPTHSSTSSWHLGKTQALTMTRHMAMSLPGEWPSWRVASGRA